MPSKTHLFTFTHWLLKAAAIFCLAGAAVLVLATGGLIVMALRADHFGVPAVLDGITRTTIVEVGLFLLACLLAYAVMVFFTFQLTAKIVATAMRGDPFMTENADRLMLIGWLLVAVQALSEVAQLVTQYTTDHLPPQARDHIQLGFGFGDPSVIGLLAVLLIFVLAQVFRRGSEMRDELEATV
jgi:hypothetical protein